MAVIMANQEDKLLTMGDLYYSPDVIGWDTLTSLTSTNQDTVRAELESYNYTTVGHIKSFKVGHSLENEEIIRAGNCGVGELARLNEKTPTITFTRLDVNNRPVFDKMLGLDILNVAGVPTPVADEVVNFANLDDSYKIINQNGDGTKPTITDLRTANGGGGVALVEGTDYEVKEVNGVRYIVAIDGGAIVVSTDYFLNYSYTPNAYTLDGYNIEKIGVPYGLYKFVSCKLQTNNNATNNAVQDTIYFAKYVLNGELVEEYIDRTETEFAGTEASFVGATGGIYLKQKSIVTL